MEAQELFNFLKKNLKANLNTKDFQTASSLLGNIKQNYKTFCTTDSFDTAKQSVSCMQSLFTKIKDFLSKNDRKSLSNFLSSCQSEVNEFGSQQHNRFMNLLEQTGATVFGIPSFLFSGSSEDYEEYQFRRALAEGLR